MLMEYKTLGYMTFIAKTVQTDGLIKCISHYVWKEDAEGGGDELNSSRHPCL